MLSRIALRLATVEALKGKTLVGDNVLDSSITALEADADGGLLTDQEKPFIAVYTDASKLERLTSPRVLYQAGAIDLIIDTGIAMTMASRNEAGDKEVHAGIPATDEAFEFYLDIVGRQIIDALSDPSSEWSDIWRGLTYEISKIERARTSATDGTRLAAQQIRMTVSLVDDPARGETLNEDAALSRFFAKMDLKTIDNPDYDEDDPESLATIPDPVAAKMIALMRLQMGAVEEDWQTVQRSQGMTSAELLSLGRGPLVLTEEGDVPDFDEAGIVVEDLGTVTVIDE